MQFQLDQAIEVLERSPKAYRALLGGLSEAWTEADEGPDTFSPRDVLGHLIEGEDLDWIPRARIILEHGSARSFEPFDRFAFKERFAGASIAELLDLFERRRAANVDALRGFGLGADELAREGTHPDLGRVTLGQLLATWVASDLSHLAQVARVMVKRYSGAVGPWRRYMPIFDR